CAAAEAAQAYGGDPHAPPRLPAGDDVGPAGVAGARSRRDPDLRPLRLRRADARLLAGLRGNHSRGRAVVLRARAAGGQPRAHDRSGLGPDERGDAADVALVRQLLLRRPLSAGHAAAGARTAPDG